MTRRTKMMNGWWGREAESMQMHKQIKDTDTKTYRLVHRHGHGNRHIWWQAGVCGVCAMWQWQLPKNSKHKSGTAPISLTLTFQLSPLARPLPSPSHYPLSPVSSNRLRHNNILWWYPVIVLVNWHEFDIDNVAEVGFCWLGYVLCGLWGGCFDFPANNDDGTSIGWQWQKFNNKWRANRMHRDKLVNWCLWHWKCWHRFPH